jgi:hypothetical protein
MQRYSFFNPTPLLVNFINLLCTRKVGLHGSFFFFILH